MKIIRITTDLEVTIHEFPEGNFFEQNQVIRELIGGDCDVYEHVRPLRLYTVLGASNCVSHIPGKCISMLVDEEGLLKSLRANAIGCFLYGTDIHGHPIMGNILIVGEVRTGNGIDFCGIAEEVFNKIYPSLMNIVTTRRLTL